MELNEPRKMPEYGSLYFGMSDSRNEASEDSDRFVASYVDLNNSVPAVLDGRKFLVLGPKGAGKSALGWYLEASQSRGDHLATVRDASSLPLAEVPRLQTGQVPGPERTVVAWKFVLLCNYLEVLMRDGSCVFQNQREVMRVSKLLRDYGFMGDASGRALVKASATTIEIPIPKLGTIYRKESRPTLNIYNLIPYLEDWVGSASANVRHVLLIDGLDSIFLNDVKYDESLSSLVQAAYSLNQKLQQRYATGSIVLLLRNDVFSRISLSLPDSQKMRDDLSLDLDWRIMSGPGGRNAPLIQLVNRKAALAAGVESIQILDYFPEFVSVGRRGRSPRQIPTLQYLLNMTRHTPRDLLRLFDEIRKVDCSGVYPVAGNRLSDEVIREGVLKYASKYFVGAISNEFAGYEGGPANASAALSALKALNRRTFDGNDFKSALDNVGASTDVDYRRLLRLLFFAGAIGNYVAGQDQSYMQFYHRRDDSEIYLHGTFILHNALIHAWGLGGKVVPMSAPTAEASGAVQPRPRRRRTHGGVELPSP